MPLRLDVRKKLSSRSDRVKSVDLHPTEDWMLASLYNGNVHVWNHETQQIVKTFEVCDLPVRVAKFVARKNWVVTGSDDMKVRVFNYNTLERVHQFDAHADYIRSIAVHPTSSFVLTSSDDMSIKLWDWDKKWSCTQVFEGHTHYVMQIVFNPKDNNSFASGSLDRTVKVWQLGSPTPNFTLEGHEKGVNCVAYYSGGDKPYLISGADDRAVKIWDYQNKACVQTLQGHAHNIAAVAFHPELPIILSGSEDGTFRIWHANTYRLESTLNYGMERGWSLAVQKGSNHVALGYDEGSVLIQLGREEPAMSMDNSGKILWAKHSEIQQANIKSMSSDSEVKDGERLPLDFKDLGSSDLYPQAVRHNANGRFVVVQGDGEYVIYTAMALRNKCFGAALDFVWAADGNDYAIRENNSQVKIFKNFKEKTSFKPAFGAEGIYGGNLLGVKSTTGLAFFDWETAKIVRRIEITSKHVVWNESGTLVCIATDENFFILKYDAEAVANGSKIDEDGIEDAFEVVGEVSEVMRTGVWVGDCFIYTNSLNRLNYFVGGEIVTVSHLDKVHYILGYLPKENRVYLGDKEMNVVSYALLLSVMEYQTCVMRHDFNSADEILPTIPKEHRNRVAHFLEKQGFKAQALAVTTDPEHQFDLALHLGDLKTAVSVASTPAVSTEQKWKQLAEVATKLCDFQLAQHCLHQAEDFGGLLLLASAAGNSGMVEKLGTSAELAGKNNIAFISFFILGKLEECLQVLLQSNRLAEAAFFARTYLPSQISRVVGLWKESVGKKNAKAASAIADPTDYENLFPGLRQCFQAENYLKTERTASIPALAFPSLTPNEARDIDGEVAVAIAAGNDLDPIAPAAATAEEGDEEEETFEEATAAAPLLAAAASPAAPLAFATAALATPIESPRSSKDASPFYEDATVSQTPPPLPAAVEETAAAKPNVPVVEDEKILPPAPSLLPPSVSSSPSPATASPRPDTPELKAPNPSADSTVVTKPLSMETLVDVCQTLSDERQLSVTALEEKEAGEKGEEKKEGSLPPLTSAAPALATPVDVVAPAPDPLVAEPEGKDSSVEPEGKDSSVEPEGKDSSAEPEGKDSSAEPEGKDSSAEPEGVGFSASVSSLPGEVEAEVVSPIGEIIISEEPSDDTTVKMDDDGANVIVDDNAKETPLLDVVDDNVVVDEVYAVSLPIVSDEGVVEEKEAIVVATAVASADTVLNSIPIPIDDDAVAAPMEKLATTAAPTTTLPLRTSSLFTVDPFNDLFDSAIQTLKLQPEVNLDRLDDPFAALGGGWGESAAPVAVPPEPPLTASVDTLPADLMEKDLLGISFTIPAAAAPAAATVEIDAITNASTSPPIPAISSVADPLDSWLGQDVQIPKSKEPSPSSMAKMTIPTASIDLVETDPAAVAAGAAAAADANRSQVLSEEGKDDDDFGDEWGDDEWGDDFEEGSKAPVESAAATAAAKTDDDAADAAAKELEAELELDLDDINLDNVDTSDLNLSDDLLSD